MELLIVDFSWMCIERYLCKDIVKRGKYVAIF